MIVYTTTLYIFLQYTNEPDRMLKLYFMCSVVIYVAIVVIQLFIFGL